MNIATEEIRGNAILLLGYNKEGQSTHAWLANHYPNIQVAIADKNIGSPIGDTNVQVYSGSEYLASLSAYSTVIRSPGISPYLSELVEYQKNGGHITSATNIFLSQVRGQTVGVTGTKGKSTTASLIAHILRATHTDVRLVGNIGTPMLDLLDDHTHDTVFVAELSSHQLADVRYSPKVAVLLGIVPEHLDYYPTLDSYIAAKANITKFQTKEDVLIYNPSSSRVAAIAEASQAQKYLYGDQALHDAFVYVQDGSMISRTSGKPEIVMHISDVPLLGNIENIMAAVSAAGFFGVPAKTIGDAIHPFKSLPHRLEPIGEYRGITFYNDSLATIPEAAIHALMALGDRVDTLIVGGYDRHLDFVELGNYLSMHPVKTLILFPDTGEKIWEAIKDADAKGTMQKFAVSSMEEAVRLAYAHTAKGKICLLSPASASYNIFRDYADRGDQFRAWVTTLAK